jgi:hypothetical protein
MRTLGTKFQALETNYWRKLRYNATKFGQLVTEHSLTV